MSLVSRIRQISTTTAPKFIDQLISQGSVALWLVWWPDGIFSDHFIPNFLLSVPVKEFDQRIA